MCGTACVKHSTFWLPIVSFLLAAYSPPGRPLEKKELGLVSVSPSVSVALVSTLATVSVHFCLCRVGLHTCKCQSTASSSVSVTVRVVILTAPLNESIINAYRRQSQNSCSYLLPQGSEPESSCAGTCVSSHYNNFLSGFAVRIECDRARVSFCLN